MSVVRMVVNDTCTGEETTHDVVMSEISLDSITDALNLVNVDEGEDDPLNLSDGVLVQHGTTYAFIFKWTDDHFGDVLITGHIYTEFN